MNQTKQSEGRQPERAATTGSGQADFRQASGPKVDFARTIEVFAIDSVRTHQDSVTSGQSGYSTRLPEPIHTTRYIWSGPTYRSGAADVSRSFPHEDLGQVARSFSNLYLLERDPHLGEKTYNLSPNPSAKSKETWSMQDSSEVRTVRPLTEREFESFMEGFGESNRALLPKAQAQEAQRNKPRNPALR